jgi:hypothetical protein
MPKLQLISPNGGTLNTAGTYCDGDIEIIPKLQDKTVTENGTVTADEGFAGLGEVVVDVQSGGGAEFNIAYGDTAPEDTSKLWVKTAEPEDVQITPKLYPISEEIDIGVSILPTTARYIASAVVGTKVYLFGGRKKSDLNTINVFNTESNTITTLSTTLPNEANGIASAVVGTKVYLFGGSTSGSLILDTINVFFALTELPTNNMLIETSTTENTFNLLPNMLVGVRSVYIGNADGYAERAEAYLHNGTEWVAV